MAINSMLLDSIENELIQNQQTSYQKVIPIKNYSYETKITLDYLIDKYGGFINRYDDKIILYINNSLHKNNDTPKANEENKYVSLRFERINTSINSFNDRLSIVEDKISRLITEQNKQLTFQNKNLQSYLSYFKTNENKKEADRLLKEILNHH
ncbi:hypothetical protein KHQ81_13490 [Mycoplasmatota bacterium]|nr:hypothetical protein KHQ81_13490 [Mycoplasmatota bacterium]